MGTLKIVGDDRVCTEIMAGLPVSVDSPNELFATLNAFESGGQFYGCPGTLHRTGDGWVLHVDDHGDPEHLWFTPDGTVSRRISTAEYARASGGHR